MNSSDYLQIMGISQWRLRAITAAIYYRYAFYEDGGSQPIAYLLADATLANAAEQQLVEAIAKAIKKKFIGEQVTDFNFTDFTPTRVMILLGEQVIKIITPAMGNHPVVRSYSPADLLANPSLKAKTWEEIQKAMKIMG